MRESAEFIERLFKQKQIEAKMSNGRRCLIRGPLSSKKIENLLPSA